MTEGLEATGGKSARGASVAADAQREERIAYLATGFALGALETPELQELYDALRERGDAGRAAAGVAWKVLGLTVDLRATLGSQLQDTVAHRVEALASGADEPGEFVDRFRAQLGVAHPRLAEVEIPEGLIRRGRWVLLAGLVAAAIAAAAVLLARSAPERIARVLRVRGAATVEGRALAPGAVLDRRPVIVGAGGLVELEWPEGHMAAVQGPANLVPQGEGLSLSSGATWIVSKGPFTVGLPDGRARLGPATRLAVEVVANRSVLGVAGGRASVGGEGAGGGAPSSTLEEGRAAVLGETTGGPGLTVFRWQRDGACRGEGAARVLERDGDAAAWRFEAVVAWAGKEGSVLVRGATAKGGGVRLEPGAVVIAAPDGRETRHAVPGAPLLARRMEMRRAPGRAPVVLVEGLAAEVPLPFGDPPAEVRLSGSARLVSTRYHTGPPPLPSPE